MARPGPQRGRRNSLTRSPRRGQRGWFSYGLHLLRSPYFRYHNARYLHGLRVAAAMGTSILFTSISGIPHGFWSSVTLLVVIGGLQHHGNIRRKAFERGVATAMGAGLGLLLIGEHRLIGSTVLTYSLTSVMAGVCAYYAVGRAGYIALLTAITLIIVAGHGDNPIDIGLWRALNVIIGTAIALLFSFAFPLYATYDWRFRLADNLRECARLYPRVMTGSPMTAAEQVATFARLSRRLVTLRSLIAPVARELQVPTARLEEIQRLHRSIISGIEMLAVNAHHRGDTPEWGSAGDILSLRRSSVSYALLASARALRSGRKHAVRHLRVFDAGRAQGADPDRDLGYHLQGSYWLAQRLAEYAHRLAAEMAALPLR